MPQSPHPATAQWTPDPSWLTAQLHETLGAAGWLPAPTAPTATPPLGAWSAPHEGAHLTAATPGPNLYLQEPFATIALTGATATSRPWTVTGPCPLAVLPALLRAVSLRPGTPAPDPASLLPRGDYFYEASTGYPPGQYYSERWIQWEAPGPFHRLDELCFFVPGPTFPGAVPGWQLALYGTGTALNADLLTPRHVIAAMVTALTQPSTQTRATPAATGH
jgi:hypothetical protein